MGGGASHWPPQDTGRGEGRSSRSQGKLRGSALGDGPGTHNGVPSGLDGSPFGRGSPLPIWRGRQRVGGNQERAGAVGKGACTEFCSRLDWQCCPTRLLLMSTFLPSKELREVFPSQQPCEGGRLREAGPAQGRPGAHSQTPSFPRARPAGPPLVLSKSQSAPRFKTGGGHCQDRLTGLYVGAGDMGCLEEDKTPQTQLIRGG